MDYQIEQKFQQLIKYLQDDFDADLDLQGVLYLIGVQELGLGYQKFKKHEKMDLFHVAVCTVLEPYGYYTFSHNDEQGWPHFDVLKELPPLSQREQEHFMKQAIIEYFEVNQIFTAKIVD